MEFVASTAAEDLTADVAEKLAVTGEEDDDSNDDEEAGAATGGKKKKKKKKRSKKKAVELEFIAPHSRVLGGSTNYFMKYGQTNPPTIPVWDLFMSPGTTRPFPPGEIQEHALPKFPLPDGISTTRLSKAEKLEKEQIYNANTDLYGKVRHAAEVHRQVRCFAQSIIKPGIRLDDMCAAIEDKNRELMQENGIQRGIGFPTGCSINHVAAHYTPNTGDNTVLQYGDVMKIDFGTQIDGRIIDCAYTVAFDPVFDPLLEAVKAATEAGIRAAGIDVQLCEVGAAVQEVMESHEVTLPSRPTGGSACATSTSMTTRTVKCCRNLHGHNIGAYEIHAGNSVPIVASDAPAYQARMMEGEFYAIETFGSTGRGFVDEIGECSHFMKNYQNKGRVEIRSAKARQLYGHINKTFSSLAFCRRWLDRPDGGSATVHKSNGRQENHLAALNHLCDLGLVNQYPPLVDTPNSYVAQYEHTLLLRPTCKEVLSRGEDY